MPQAYSYYSHYEALTLAFIRERIGRGLRERYPAPKELPPKLWALVVKLDAALSTLHRPLKQQSRRQNGKPGGFAFSPRAVFLDGNAGLSKPPDRIDGLGTVLPCNNRTAGTYDPGAEAEPRVEK